VTAAASGITQVVRAEAGHAYGVIGADLHVFAGRGPVYLLANHTPTGPNRTLALDDGGLPAQPSDLLNARSAVVAFTGRHSEVRDLTTWRDSNQRLGVRWLHAPGGQGKTRLAGHIADDTLRRGWKVIVADHAAGKIDARHPTSQDLRIGAAARLLLVVDYADRWPLAHLTWLFSNKVLNQDVPVRVLLLARTAHVWPALRHALTQADWPPQSCASLGLGPLPNAEDSRDLMFTAARDSFAECYRLPDPHVIPVPDGLARDEFGLTLAVHMAALVAVDRHAHAAAPQPLADMTGLTAYLLDREHHHWRALYDTGATRAGVDPAGGRVAFDTAPEQMTRAVFAAALTGPLGYRNAKSGPGHRRHRCRRRPRARRPHGLLPTRRPPHCPRTPLPRPARRGLPGPLPARPRHPGRLGQGLGRRRPQVPTRHDGRPAALRRPRDHLPQRRHRAMAPRHRNPANP
jgi:hypothetical protein